MKKILITGLFTLHWGRLQYGNVGNYYIVEPLFQYLHKYFADYRILTTFQMDGQFAEKEKITIVPMEYYYGWDKSDVSNAEEDVRQAQWMQESLDYQDTPWLSVIHDADIIINVAGDMWGDNAEHVGKDRFYVDCLKMKAAQVLKKKTFLFAVTPGPFTDKRIGRLALEVFKGFTGVFVREKVSFLNLKKWNFGNENVTYYPCPSFLFERDNSYSSKWLNGINQKRKKTKVAGITFGGFNLPCGPYDMWPRGKEQYDNFIRLAEYLIEKLQVSLCIFSHTNGFEREPEFKRINGRDFQILQQFYEILIEKNPLWKQEIILIDEPLLPKQIKTIISSLDMLVTGRVHASVAAISSCVPTVFIEYDRRVIYSDKMLGFASVSGMQEYVCEPDNFENMIETVRKCYKNRETIISQLKSEVPKIQDHAKSAFQAIRRKCQPPKYAFYISGNSDRLKHFLEQASEAVIGQICFVFSEYEIPYELGHLITDKSIKKVICLYKDINEQEQKKKNQRLSDALMKSLDEFNVDYCFSFGAHLLSGEILLKYKNHLINFHPSILPMFPGRKSIDRALESKSAFLLGNTAHFIDEGMDTGLIIMQSVIPVQAFIDANYNYDCILDIQVEMLNQLIKAINDDQLDSLSGRIKNADYQEYAVFPRIEGGSNG
ncbi:hypothetical protein C807_02832 [Lachnospiraceae bacterium 28-4]|nr:hypothetical protein C807_02832 [Lachnospiraceae bacterium 28-4]